MKSESRLGRRQVVVATMATVLLFGLGEWLGEDLVATPVVLFLVVWPGTMVVGAVVIVGLFLAWRRGWARWFLTLVVLFSASVVGGYSVGRHLAVSAFNDCVERGESLRRALRDYRQERGRYPTTLAELPAFQVPGHRPMRGSILEYASDGNSYTLAFGDWLVQHEATETSAFVTRK